MHSHSFSQQPWSYLAEHCGGSRTDGWEPDELQNSLYERIKVAACISDLKNGLVCPNTYLFLHNYI